MPLLGQHDPRFIVVYPDGKRSERMDKSTAHNYASLFGGLVVCVEFKPTLWERIKDFIFNIFFEKVED